MPKTSIVTKPVLGVVTLTEMKDWLKVGDSEDAIVWHCIKSATEYIQEVTQRCFVQTTYNLYLENFPSTKIVLPYPPLVSVSSVKYYDTSEVQQTLSASLYRVDIYDTPGTIEIINSWPSYFSKVNTIEVQYVAGYTNSDNIPSRVKEIVLILAAHLFENRQQFAMNPGYLFTASMELGVYDQLQTLMIWKNL